MKVTIRTQEETDRAILDKFYEDEEVSKELYLPSNKESWIAESRKSLKEAYRFTILANDRIAGRIALEFPTLSRDGYEVSFVVGQEFWNEAVQTQALKQIVSFGFCKLKLNELHSDTDSDDLKSAKALQNAGFRKAAVWQEHVFLDSDYVDIVIWSLRNKGRVGDPNQGGDLNVQIKEFQESDTAVLDKLYIDEDVSRRIRLPSSEDLVPGSPYVGSRGWNRWIRNPRWIPEFRASLEDAYYFTILADGEIAGEIMLEHPSVCRSTYRVGYAVGRKYWNQGICTEALKQIVRFAFDELKIHKIACDTESDNPASLRVLEKGGFRKEEEFGDVRLPGERKSAYSVHTSLFNPRD
jgi:RimJ/RimL family protein N-acetyltransferase